MMRVLSSLIIGVIFGLGIVIGGMANPAKVVNFFDIVGTWDPSLAFVMGGALAVTMVGYRLVLRRSEPVFGGGFALPTRSDIDARLLGGSVVFGIGWGIAGFCPGGSIPTLGTGRVEVLVFVAAMIAGMALVRVAGRGR